jgi:hypothetical protein
MTTRNEHFGTRDLAYEVAVPTTRPKGALPPGQRGDHYKKVRRGSLSQITPAQTNVFWLIWKVVVGVFFRRRPTSSLGRRSQGQ